MTLNKLIEELIAIRDNEPTRGENEVVLWQQDGDRYPITMVDDTMEDVIDINF